MTKMSMSVLKEIISDLSGIPVEELSKDTALVEDLQLDSLKFVELMAILGEDYQVVISEEQALNLQTIGQVYALVNAST